MDRAQLLQLEQASVDIMSPPHVVTEERRKQSEAVFMDFQKMKSPYGACKFILENSQMDFVQFQSVSVMKEAVMREWQLLSNEEKAGLRQYLLHFVTGHPGLVSYVQRQLLHTLALMVKRATLEPGFSELFRSILDFVAQLLGTGEIKMRQIAGSLLTSFLTEYSSSTGSSALGLPLEFHLECKKAIEKEQLLQMLQFAVQVLQQFTSLENHTLSGEEHAFLSTFLQLVSQVLNWDFRQLPRFFRTNAEAINVVLRPPRSYASTFLDPAFLALFFRLLGKVHSDEGDFHLVVQCLTQLASLTRPVFTSDKERKDYLTVFVTGLLEYIHSRLNLSRQEVYGLSCILRRLTSTFNVIHFGALGEVKLETLLQTVAQLACVCAEKSVKEEEDWSFSYSESREHYLEVCTTLLDFSGSTHFILPKERLVGPLTGVFEAYIKSKLSAPKGWNTQDLDEDEIVDIVEDDRVQYADELTSVGNIARGIPHYSLPLLISLLEEQTAEGYLLLLMIQQDPEVLRKSRSALESLFEDLHWLVLVAGYTLSDVVKGEAVLIPTELMKHSIQLSTGRKEKGEELVGVVSGGGGDGSWSNGRGIQASSAVAGKSAESSGNFMGVNVAAVTLEAGLGGEGGGGGVRLSDLDPVVGVIMAVCRLTLLEKKFVSGGLEDVLSPQLCESVAWCLQRIAEPYVMFSDQEYSQVSLPLVEALGKESESGQWLVVFLVAKVVFNLSHWSSEESLAHTSIQLLQSVAKSIPRANVCIQCEDLWSLMRDFASGSETIAVLPPRVQRSLMTSLVMSAMGNKKKTFLSQLLESLQSRFSALVQAQDFQSRCREPETMQTLLSLLESMCGLASCTRIAFIQEFFRFLLPVLQMGIKLLPLYKEERDVLPVILELFVLVAENYIVFLTKTNTIEMYRATLQLIQTYAEVQSVTSVSVVQLGSEESRYEDLLLFMKLLSFLTTKDYLDMAPTEGDGEGQGGSGVSVEALQVVMEGIRIVLNIITEDLLKYPGLCSQFYSLVHYTCQCYPQNVLALSDSLVLSIMNLLELGLNNFTQEICGDCLDSIYSLVVHFGSSPDLHSLPLLNQSFQHFLKVLFELVLSPHFDVDLLGGAAAAIFSLICTQQSYYTSLAEVLVSSQSSNPQNHSRLVAAFQKLTPPSLSLDLSSPSKLAFEKNLEEFLPFVKGFLNYQ